MSELMTRKYDKLPPPQAVPFSGFDFAKIKSREPIEKELETYLKRTKEASFFTASLIIAEWGEGKTDAFNRYILPKTHKDKNIAYLVSTSSIINKISNIDKIIPSSPPESISLMGCVLYALKDELELSGEKTSLFPDYNSLTSPLEYLENILEAHLNNKIYIFIDEFEEILNHTNEIQKKVLSGLKELLNGQIQLIEEGGKYPGKIHFIIACTPYAFNRIRSDVDLSQIFGALDSRLSSNIIKLPQIHKDEAMNFLMDLIKYCYNNDLPEKYPLNSSGILNTIVTISQYNLRSLVQLISDLLIASANNGEAKIIDSELLIDTYIDKSISVYGSTTERIDKELFYKINESLNNLAYGDKYIKIMHKLIGETKTYHNKELEKILNIKNIHSRINEINIELKKIGIPKCICGYDKLKEGCEIDDVISSLSPVNNVISIGENKKIEVEELIEILCDYIINENNELEMNMFIPHEKEDLIKILDVPEFEIDDFYQKISKHFIQIAAERHYKIAKDLLDQIFPSPLVFQLDHIIDRNKRMDLWRDSLKNLMNYDRELLYGVIETLNQDPNYNIEHSNGSGILHFNDRAGHENSINSYLDVKTSKVSMNDVQEIRRHISERNPNLYLLFYIGELNQTVFAEINKIPKLVSVSIRPIRAQQLIATQLARKKSIRINEYILTNRLRELLFELEFGTSFNLWLKKMKEMGYLIEELDRPSGETENSMVQALSYFINTISKETTIRDTYLLSQKLQDFTVYKRGKRASFAPLDIEKMDTLEKYIPGLAINNFIDIKDNKILLKNSPTENRILNILQRKPLSALGLKERFIILSRNETVFENVYLSILEKKGLIIENDGSYELVDRSSYEIQIKDKVQNYFDNYKDYSIDDLSYAHVISSKERGDRIIILDEFDSYLKELLNKFNNDVTVRYDNEISLRTLKLLSLLVDHYNNELKTYFINAKNKGKEIIKIMEEINEDFKSNIESIVHLYNKYTNYDYETSDIIEVINYNQYYENYEAVVKKTYNREELEDGLQYVKSSTELDLGLRGIKTYFHFNRTPDEASYFNYKIFELKKKSKAVNTRKEEMDNILEDIKEQINKINTIDSKIKSAVIKYSIKNEYMTSNLFLEKIKNYQFQSIEENKYEILNLSDILSYFKKYRSAIETFDNNLRIITQKLESLIQTEKKYFESKKKVNNRIRRIKEFYNTKDEFSKKTAAISHEYDNNASKYTVASNMFMESTKNETDIINIIAQAEETERNISSLVDNYSSMNTNIDALLINTKSYFMDLQKEIKIFVEIVENIGFSLADLFDSFCETIRNYNKLIDTLDDQEEIALTFSEIMEDISLKKNEFLEMVKEHVSKDEYTILLEIIAISKTKQWNEMVELNSMLKEKVNLPEEDIIKNVRKLIDKKLLQVGVKLPI